MSLSWRILRRLAWFALAYLLLAGAVLSWAARQHVEQEANSEALAAFLANIERVRSGDATVIDSLSSMRSEGRIRHLDFDLRRAGQTVLPAVRTGRGDSHDARTWSVDWTDAHGAMWTLDLRPDARAELAEVNSDAALLLILTLGLGTIVTIGVVMSVRAEVASLAALNAAIACYAKGDFTARTPAMRTREFDAIGNALNALADALRDARDRAQALSRQLVAAEDAQNRWIARELHDELGQWLTAARAEAAFLRAQTQGVAREAAESLERALTEMVARVRVLLERLRPHGFEDDPLPASALEQSVRELVASWRARHGIAAAIELQLAVGSQPMPNAVAMAAYRVVQEALSNAMRHGQASRVLIRVSTLSTGLEAVVEDDGATVLDVRVPGRGLAGLAERVGTLGGTLDAGPKAVGWRVRAWLPPMASVRAA